MTPQPYSQLVDVKRWADRGLYEVVSRNIGRLPADDAVLVLRILDHVNVVDRIFQHHLQGLPHKFAAPRSERLPELLALTNSAKEVDDWYVSYVGGLSQSEFDAPVAFRFTNGTRACMRRGEIVLHVCLHGTYHRGNAGVILQKSGIAPNDDRMTDFLETVRGSPLVQAALTDHRVTR